MASSISELDTQRGALSGRPFVLFCRVEQRLRPIELVHEAAIGQRLIVLIQLEFRLGHFIRTLDNAPIGPHKSDWQDPRKCLLEALHKLLEASHRQAG